jgi:hypothetical protein
MTTVKSIDTMVLRDTVDQVTALACAVLTSCEQCHVEIRCNPITDATNTSGHHYLDHGLLSATLGEAFNHQATQRFALPGMNKAWSTSYHNCEVEQAYSDNATHLTSGQGTEELASHRRQ